MFSKLSKGYGSWTAGYVDPYFGENKDQDHSLPEIDLESHSHIHGVTVGTHSGRSTAMSWTTTKRSREPTLDGIPLPKTYTTKTGALQLYVYPDEDENEEDQGLELKPRYVQIRRPMGQELIDLSLKLGTLERLAKCVLSFGDQDYDHEHTSISDAKNKVFLKFLHSVDGSKVTATDVDAHAQPGGDLNRYLRDLKSSASNRYSEDGRIYVTKSRESLELQALLQGLDNNSWPLASRQDGASDRHSSGLYTRPVSQISFTDPSPMPPSTPRSTHRVLSAKKVAASIKYGTYLGRPSSKLSVDDDDTLDTDYSSPQYVPTTNIARKAWTPTESMDESLLDARGRFCWGTGEDNLDLEDSKKRRRFRERTYLTSSDLYQGRNAQKGEGQCVVEVKGTGKGDGDSVGKGHRMSQIKEELGDINDSCKNKTDVRDNNCAQNLVVLKQQINDDAQVVGVHVKDAKFIEQEIHRKTLCRPNSKSEISFDTHLRNNKPSIITIQTCNASKCQMNTQNKHQILFKKVKSNDMNFDKDSSKKVPMRKAIENHLNVIEQTNAANDSILTNISDDYSGTLKAGVYTFSPGTSRNWSLNEEYVPGNAVENDSHVTNAKQYIEGVQETASLYPHMFKMSTLGLSTDVSLTHEPPKIIDIKLEEKKYIADDIHECNEEIQQIKAQHEDNSDTDSCTDEEIFKVMCEGQTVNECEDDMEMYHKIHALQINTTNCQTNKIEENSFSGIQPSNIQDDSFVVEDTIGIGDADEKMVTSLAKLEDVRQTEEEVEEVTDEKISEVKSERSSQKFWSRKSLSGAMEDDEDTTMFSSSQVLPQQLLSDRLMDMSEKETVSDAEAQLQLDGVTVFSGATDSYSDLLADRLVSPSLSRPLPAKKSSRPGSAVSAKPTSASNSRPSSALPSHLNTGASDDHDMSKLDDDVDTQALTKTELLKNQRRDDVTKSETKLEVDKEGAKIHKQIQVDVEEFVGKTIENDIFETNDLAKDKGKAIDKELDNELKQFDMQTVDNVAVLSTEDKLRAEPLTVEMVNTTEIDKELKIKLENHTISNDEIISKPDKLHKQLLPVETVKRTESENSVTFSKAVKVDKSNSDVKRTSQSWAKKAVSGRKSLLKKSMLDNIKLGGEGLIDASNYDKTCRLDSVAGNTGQGALKLENGTITDAHSIVTGLDSLGLRKPADKKKGKKDGAKHAYHVLPPGPRPKPPPEKVKIPEHIAEALKRNPTASIQQLEQELEKMSELVDETLSGPTLQAIGEGLTEEELELAKVILEKKIAKAKGKLDEKEVTSTTGKKKGGSHKGEKKGKKKKAAPLDDRSQDDIDRDAIREKHEAEKMKRDLEAAELQQKIAEKRALLQAQEDTTSAKSKEIRGRMEELEREAEDLQRAEDEARNMLAEIRKRQREEREARRKADQDKKKLEAAARREREKRELEEKKKKELALNEKIADAEIRRRIREEEEQKMFEEERLAQEKYEEELRKAQEEAEAEEERLKERERQVEEEAMQRLIEEREAAERMRRKLMEEEEAMREMEKLNMEKIQEEQHKLQEERQRMLEWEKAKREAERERFQELCRLQEEARAKMRAEIEKRRADAMIRRDYNVENKQNVDKLRHGQGITKAWTFSYFVHWDREKYERRMGTDPKKRVKIKIQKPKNPVEVKPEVDQANNQAPP